MAKVVGPLEDQVRALVRAGRKINAIKLVREQTGIGLKEAKDAVDEFEATGWLRLPGDARPYPAMKASYGPAWPDLLEHLRRMKSQRQAIEAIKLIREHTGLGLKEAKDIYDQL
jgi:ribosomal protein L7/L12